MATAPGGYQNIELPSLFGSPGAALEKLISRNQDESQFQRGLDERAQEREFERQQQDEAKKAMMLGRHDESKLFTPFQQFNDWVHTKASDILNKYSLDPNYTNLPLPAFYAGLEREWGDLVKGHATVTNKMQNELNDVNAITKDNKWVDRDALLNDAYNHMAADMFHKDANGEWNFTPNENIDPNKNYAAELLQQPDAYKYVNGAAIEDFNKNISQAKEEKRNYILKDAGGNILHYKGNLSPFENELVKPNHLGMVTQPPKYDIITEGRTDANGNPINTLPQDIIQNYMVNSPSRKMAFQKQFSDFMDAQGQDISKLTPNQLATAQQQFAYSAVKGLRNNQPDLFNYTRAPLGNSGGNGNAVNSVINDVYKEINTKAQNLDRHGYVRFNALSTTAQDELIKYAKDFLGKDADVNQGNLAIRKDDNGNLFLFQANTDENGNVTNSQDIVPITFTGVNLKVQPGVKEKRDVISHGNTQPTPSNKKTIANF